MVVLDLFAGGGGGRRNGFADVLGNGDRVRIQYPLEGVWIRRVRRSVGHIAAFHLDGRGVERRRSGHGNLQVILQRRYQILGIVERFLNVDKSLIQLVPRLVSLALLPSLAYQLRLDLDAAVGLSSVPAAVARAVARPLRQALSEFSMLREGDRVRVYGTQLELM